MIFDTLEHLSSYCSALHELSAINSFISTANLETLRSGQRISIDGDRVYAVVQEYDTVAKEAAVWEFHKRHIDIQYIIRGNECIYTTKAAALTDVGEYDYINDSASAAASSSCASLIRVSAGEFAVFFPGEAHKPKCFYSSASERVVKLVFKIEYAAQAQRRAAEQRIDL